MEGLGLITVNMFNDGFHISGHANYDEPGKDIVCASVSTVLQLAQMGLNALAQQYPEYINVRFHHHEHDGSSYNYDDYDDGFGGMGK